MQLHYFRDLHLHQREREIREWRITFHFLKVPVMSTPIPLARTLSRDPNVTVRDAGKCSLSVNPRRGNGLMEPLLWPGTGSLSLSQISPRSPKDHVLSKISTFHLILPVSDPFKQTLMRISGW